MVSAWPGGSCGIYIAGNRRTYVTKERIKPKTRCIEPGQVVGQCKSGLPDDGLQLPSGVEKWPCVKD